MTGNTVRLVASSGGRILIQVLLVPLLARLLTPEAFGLIAMAMPVVVFTTILGEAGLATGLVRAEAPLSAESSAFWFSAAVGALSCLAVMVLAIPFSLASRQPTLAPILLALAPALLMAGLAIVPSARLQRTRDFAAYGKVELFAASLGAMTALATALAGWGVFSLAAQQLVLAGARLAGCLTASRFLPQRRYRHSDVTSILGLSGSMLGANLLAYLSRCLDNLLIGLLIGPRPLGLYATAYQAIQIPEYVLGASARTTALPAIAQAPTRAHSAEAYFSALRLLVALATPVAIGGCLEADALVPMVLGPAWIAAAPLVSILAPLGVVWSCFQLNTAALAGLKDTRGQIWCSSITSGLGLLGILAGLRWGVSGVALGYAAGTILAAGPNFFYVLKAFAAPAHRVAEVLLQPLASGLVMIAAIHWLHGRAIQPVLQLLGAGALGLIAYAAAWLAFEIIMIDP